MNEETEEEKATEEEAAAEADLIQQAETEAIIGISTSDAMTDVVKRNLKTQTPEDLKLLNDAVMFLDMVMFKMLEKDTSETNAESKAKSMSEIANAMSRFAGTDVEILLGAFVQTFADKDKLPLVTRLTRAAAASVVMAKLDILISGMTFNETTIGRYAVKDLQAVIINYVRKTGNTKAIQSLDTLDKDALMDIFGNADIVEDIIETRKMEDLVLSDVLASLSWLIAHDFQTTGNIKDDYLGVQDMAEKKKPEPEPTQDPLDFEFNTPFEFSADVESKILEFSMALSMGDLVNYINSKMYPRRILDGIDIAAGVDPTDAIMLIMSLDLMQRKDLMRSQNGQKVVEPKKQEPVKPEKSEVTDTKDTNDSPEPKPIPKPVPKPSLLDDAIHYGAMMGLIEGYDTETIRYYVERDNPKNMYPKDISKYFKDNVSSEFNDRKKSIAHVKEMFKAALKKRVAFTEYGYDKEKFHELIALAGYPALDLSVDDYVDKFMEVLEKDMNGEDNELAWYAEQLFLRATKLINSKSKDMSSNKEYYDRDKSYYGLKDYSDNSDNSRNVLYTVEINNYTKAYTAKGGQLEGYGIMTKEERLAFLGMGDGSSPEALEDFTKVGVVAVTSKKNAKIQIGTTGNTPLFAPHRDIFMYVEDELGNRKILSQVNSEIIPSQNAHEGLFVVTHTTAKIDEFAGIIGRAGKFTDSVVELELPGTSVSDALTMRVGEVIIKDNDTPLDEFKITTGDRIKISKTIYTVTDVNSKFAGKSFLIYSPDFSADLENMSKKLTNALAENVFARNVGDGHIPSNIGILPIDFTIPFTDMVGLDTSQFNYNSSIASIYFGKYFADHLLKMSSSKGALNITLPNGTITTIVITEAMKLQAQDMLDVFDSATSGMSDSMKVSLAEVESHIASSPAARDLMENLAEMHFIQAFDKTGKTTYNIFDASGAASTSEEGDMVGEVKESLKNTRNRWHSGNVLVPRFIKGITEVNVLNIKNLVNAFKTSPQEDIEAMSGILSLLKFSPTPKIIKKNAGNAQNAVAPVMSNDLIEKILPHATVPASDIGKQEIEATDTLISAAKVASDKRAGKANTGTQTVLPIAAETVETKATDKEGMINNISDSNEKEGNLKFLESEVLRVTSEIKDPNTKPFLIPSLETSLEDISLKRDIAKAAKDILSKGSYELDSDKAVESIVKNIDIATKEFDDVDTAEFKASGDIVITSILDSTISAEGKLLLLDKFSKLDGENLENFIEDVAVNKELRSENAVISDEARDEAIAPMLDGLFDGIVDDSIAVEAMKEDIINKFKGCM